MNSTCHGAALRLMKIYMGPYLANLQKPIECQGRGFY